MSTDTESFEDATGLDAAASAFEALLNPATDNSEADEAEAADDDAEDESHAEEAEDVEAENEFKTPDTEDEESEESEDEDEATDDAADPELEGEWRTKEVTVEIDGKATKVTLDDLVKGSLRQSDYTRKTQELAESRKAFEAEASEVKTARDQYKQLLAALEEKLTAFGEANPEPNWQELYQRDPLEFVRQQQIHAERKEHLQAAKVHKQHIEAQQQAEAQAVRAKQQERVWEEATAAVPEWKDSKRWERARDQIVGFGQKIGFTAQELNAACSSDSRVLLAMHKASEYEKLMSSKPKPNGASTGPKTATPSAKSAAPTPASDLTRAKQRLAKTGKADDAAAIFETMLSARRR